MIPTSLILVRLPVYLVLCNFAFKEFADKYKLKLLEFKKDGNQRLYFSYEKL
jgi:hypothetical protein